jgi:hypothetical protein
MNDLRKAAEMALKYFEDAHGLEDDGGCNQRSTTPSTNPRSDPEVSDPARVGNRPTRHRSGFDSVTLAALVLQNRRYVCECDSTPQPPKREWVGLTKEDFYKKDDETVFVLGMKFAEARLKEKNT